MLRRVSWSNIILLPLLLSSTTKATPTNIWHISIFEGPAPPPGKGPPIQASALRDKSYLPAQIASLVAAYVLSLLVIGTAILFVGRRLRRATQASPKSLSMEMMKPADPGAHHTYGFSPMIAANNNPYDASPNSAVDLKANWPSPNRSTRASSAWGSIKKGHRRHPSESQASVVTFDENVIEDDKVRNEREMERLYAAVMDHDEKRSSSKVNLAGQQLAQRPPELQHLRDVSQPSAAPRPDIKSPTRTSTRSPRTTSRPTPISVHSFNSSRSSLGSFSKKHSVRGLPISSPMGSPGLAPDFDDSYGETEPLSPRLYPDPGPPPPPPDEQLAARNKHRQMENSRLSPRDARFPMTSLRQGAPVPSSPGVHRQTIHEVSSRPELQSRVSDRSTASRKKAPPPLAINSQAAASAGAQHHPLRSAPLPLRVIPPTNYNADRGQPSPAIKATVLERKLPRQVLRTPMTGVPMTPYSPYMPRTPLTPMTPSRLVTRGERKKREKEEGRRVPTIEDAVEEEADMWGDAYQ